MRIIFSEHAKMRLLERDINEETARYVVENPDYVKISFEDRKIAVKQINSKRWSVVYVETGKILKIITIY